MVRELFFHKCLSQQIATLLAKCRPNSWNDEYIGSSPARFSGLLVAIPNCVLVLTVILHPHIHKSPSHPLLSNNLG